MIDIRTQNELKAYRLLQKVRDDINSRALMDERDWLLLLDLINDFIKQLEGRQE